MKAGWKKSAYTAAVVLHVLAWLVALAGLAATQSRCKDDEAYPATDSLFAPEVGSDCSKLFRFPWFVWALNFLPVLLSLGAVLKPDIFGVSATTLWAVVTVLNILMANSFNNVRDSDALGGSTKDRALAALAGFAIMAATGLLIMLVHGMLHEDKAREHTGSEVTGGKMDSHEVHVGAAREVVHEPHPVPIVRPVREEHVAQDQRVVDQSRLATAV